MAQASSSGGNLGPQGDALVIFGITGDLAKKMTLKALYDLVQNGTLQVPVVGVARNDWSDKDLHQHARDAVERRIKEKGEEFDEDAFKKFTELLTYVPGDYTDDETYKRIKKKLSSVEHPVFYLEVPPSLFATVVECLGRADLTDGARVVIEKPFGHDLASAIELNNQIHEVLDEDHRAACRFAAFAHAGAIAQRRAWWTSTEARPGIC